MFAFFATVFVIACFISLTKPDYSGSKHEGINPQNEFRQMPNPKAYNR